MATANDTKTSEQIDLHDLIDTKARQLHALLENTYGGGGDAFRGMNDQLQDNYLWACADMAGEIVASLERLSDLNLAGMKVDEVSHV